MANEQNKILNKSPKVLKFRKYNTAFAKLSHLILDLNEAQQVALLKKAEELFSKENRAFPRKSCRIPVRFSTYDRIYSGYITNISPSGIFIDTKKPLIVRDEILVDFTLKETNESLRLRGVVVHAIPMGIGVELKNVSPHLVEMIRFAVNRMKG